MLIKAIALLLTLLGGFGIMLLNVAISRAWLKGGWPRSNKAGGGLPSR